MNSNTLRALFLGIEDSQGARLVRAFHKLGYVCRFTAVEETGRLGNAIRNEAPDILLIHHAGSPIELQHCLDAIEKNQADLRVIVIADNPELLPDYQIADVLSPDNDDRIVRACLREFWALQIRRALTETQQQLKAAEERSELILSQSDEGIAYVADGMIISVNKHFAQTFDFADTDDLEYQPVIDLIQSEDQERLKNALRQLTKNEETSSRISLGGRSQNGEEIEINMRLSKSVLDGEDCVQLAICDENAAVQSSATVDSTTGFANAERFLVRLDDIAAHGLGGAAEGALLLISIDDYPSLRGQFGLSGASLVVADVAVLLKSELPQAEFGRLETDTIAALVHGYDADAALALAEKLCGLASKRHVSTDNGRADYTLSIGVLPLGTAKLPSTAKLLDDTFTVCEQIRTENGSGNGAALYVRARQQLNQGLDPQTLLEDAKADRRLRLLYQPLVSLADEEEQYYEVRLDLKDQEAGEIDGAGLIAAFEQEGQNTELDRWIIVEATKRLAASHSGGKDTRLIINLSCNVFKDKGLVPWLGVAMKAAQLGGENLVLQFNASTAGKLTKPARAFTRELEKLGASIALKSANPAGEDANSIKQLQPLLVKIEQPLDDSDKLGASIRTVQEAGGKAVVSDVASAATLATLWQLKPDYVQGDYVHAATTEMDYDFGEA